MSAQGYRLLAADVAGQSNVLAYQDGFIAAVIGAGTCLVLVALMRSGKPSPLDRIFG